MFELDKNKAVASDYPLIADNYAVLHFDDDPILFSGTNRYGNRIIGSLVDHDDDNRIARFFHVIVDSRTHFDFINQKITYLHILKNSKLIYAVDRSYDEKTQMLYHLEFDQIPFQYIPLEGSFCPKQNLKYGLKPELENLYESVSENLPDDQEEILKTEFVKTLDGFEEISEKIL
jgi:hypothetical protein